MIPVYSSRQVREADKFAIDQLGISGIVLMENAARSIFEGIMTTYPDLNELDRIGIVCGKGNNGGDGFAVARQFLINGFSVEILALAEEEELAGDAKVNFQIIRKMLKYYPDSRMSIYSAPKDLNKLRTCSMIIDALLGTGTKGALRDPYDKIIDKLNDFNSYKVAIDIPSGLDVDKGTGEQVFEADLTITLAELKKGLFFEEGYSCSGEILKGSIGIGDEYFNELRDVDEYLIEPEDALDGLPEKKKNLQKYSAGKVFVIAGSEKYTGAPALTANATLRIGAGAVLLGVPESTKGIVQCKITEVVAVGYPDKAKGMLNKEAEHVISEIISWADVVAIGPGLGNSPETIEAVRGIIKNRDSSVPFVIDADAINALGGGYYKTIDLRNTIFTPHHKEFADLTGISLSELKENILEIGKEFAKQTGAYLLLKGAPSIIFNPSGEAFINTTGNEGMAKFGTGDVLTGIIAGLLSNSKENIENGLISAVYLHSLSADLLKEEKTVYGYTANDIMENLPYAIDFLSKSVI